MTQHYKQPVLNRQKKKPLGMRAFAMILFMALFSQIALAQTTSETLKMTNGSRQVPANGYNFYDSGGPLLFDPNDPAQAANANEYNWTTWYQHNEDYTLTLTLPATSTNTGIVIEFTKVLVNNDTLRFYDGNTANPAKLIGEFCNNEYSTGFGTFKVESHGPMTIRFISDYHWRDEGWEAKIDQTSEFTPRPPVAVMAACDNLVTIIPTTMGADQDSENDKIEYQINGGAWQTYTLGSSIDLNGQFNQNTHTATVTVKATVDGVASATKTYTFDKEIAAPGVPTYNLNSSSNTLTTYFPAKPAGVNDTYYIRWKIDNNATATDDPNLWPDDGHEFQQPSNTPHTVPAGDIDYTNVTLSTPFYIHLATRGTTCPNTFSTVVTVPVTARYVPKPSITFETLENNQGKTTLACQLNGATIYYTTDGSVPDPEHVGGTNPTQQYTAPFNVPAGTTVRTLAVKEGYTTSVVASEIFVPGVETGNTQSGVYDQVVLLDDREPHTWSYYSDGTQPIHSLKPADVKITYFGYGANTMTTTNTDPNNIPNSDFNATVNANQVAVNVDEPGNQFIYMKTLENDDPDGEGNTYSYTMIHNPFQVRPVYDPNGGGSSSFSDITDFESGLNGWTLVNSSTNYWERGQAASNGGSYGLYITNGSTNTTYGRNNYTNNTRAVSYAHKNLTLSAGTYTISCNWRGYGESYYDYLRIYLAPSNITLTADNLVNGISDNGTPTGWTALDGGNKLNLSTSWGTSSQSFTISSAGSYKVVFVWTNDNSQGNQPPAAIDNISITEGGSSSADYRGFYAWRVKRLGGGLSIDGKGVGSIIYPDETIEFVTSNDEGNEVEFEALWAKAWVDASSDTQRATNNGNYQNAYERNFKTSWASYTYPVTYSSRYPNGMVATNSSFSVGSLDAGGDIKFENMTLSADRLNGNNHNLHIGRGVEGGQNNGNVTSSMYGYQNPSGNINGFNLRIESGRYTNAYLFYYTSARQVTSSNNWKMILGSDYDRAKGDNSELVIAGPVEVSYRVSSSSTSAKINVIGLSGTFGTDADDNELYMGYESRSDNNTAATPRFLEVLGGEYLGGISGGIENGVTAATPVLTMRIKGGTIQNYVYGAGQYYAAIGSRKTIITGGTFDAWVAGGCYGTDSQGNAGGTDGDAYIYFGGNANMTNTEGIFGGGYGRGDAGDNKYTINRSFVVVADEAQIAGNVYGGGNKGYNTDDAEVYVLGGGKNTLTVNGSVFGGANQARSEATTTVTMKGGKVNGSLYGGANESGAVADVATVNVSGGTVTNVFGGGKGSGTNMSNGTLVNINGGTINNNVYGGGEEGTVSAGNTNVTIGGGTMKDVYGAGKGSTSETALVSGTTTVIVNGGTMDNVYGGGEAGDVNHASGGGGSTSGTTETFNNTTAASYNANQSYIPDGWQRYSSGTSYAFLPRVSNNSNYNGISNNDGNYLLFTARQRSNGTQHQAYAIMPRYDEIATITFNYRYQNTQYGTLTVGYVTNNSGYNTFTEIKELNRTTIWTSASLTSSEITTINNASGYIAFRYISNSTSTSSYYSAAIDDVVVTVAGSSTPAGTPEIASTVSIKGGTINQDVFGGGRLGKTDGNVVVNVIDGDIAGNVYGGAFGKKDQVYVAGTHTVNMTGGNVYSSVYGGSRNADDALKFTGNTADDDDPVSRVNISGGHVYYQVFTSGYFGKTYGSVYAFIGHNAIYQAPNSAPTENVSYNAAALIIDGSVWAGADFGNFNGTTFGDATIMGYSNVYIDGEGYNTQSTKPSDAGYMNIGGSVLGCGTSCYAGVKGRDLVMRNYGKLVENPAYNGKDDDEPIIEKYNTATRNMMSIQFFNEIALDATHVHLIGQGRINSLSATEKYSLYEIDEVAHIVNGSSLFVDYPADQITKLGSYTCAEANDLPGVYSDDPDYVVVGYGDLATEGKDNKFRVNNGSYLNVKRDNLYGELEGYFYMMTDDRNNTCAYARPKQSRDQGNGIAANLDNPLDGGFVSYHTENNTYDAGTLTLQDGTYVFASTSDAPGTVNEDEDGVQMAYENHTVASKAGEQYFRIWRYGGKFSFRQNVFNAKAKTTAGYSTCDVVIDLPASRGTNSYFRIKLDGGFPMIDYGTDVLTVNAGCYNSTDGTPATDGWMYYDASDEGNTANSFVTGCSIGEDGNEHVNAGLAVLDQNKNANFGLVAIPQGSLAGGTNENWLICTQASNEGEALTTKHWVNNNATINPSILFRLTYNNDLTNNVTWDPIIITLEQCDAQGNVKDEIQIALSISTSTDIEQDFSAQTYALMTGNGTTVDTYTAKVVLPPYIPVVNEEGELSKWTFVSAVWNPNQGTDENPITEFDDAFQQGSGYLDPSNQVHYNNRFSMQIVPSANFDNTVGWEWYDNTVLDVKASSTVGHHLASTTGRHPAAFDFILHYDGEAKTDQTILMGILTITLNFTNYQGGTAPLYDKNLTIDIEVWRRGEGVNFYLDGVNGSNFFSGRYPNSAMETLSGIFTRSGYRPGDNIFIVNTVTANSSTGLDWNGEQYSKVILYRYPGGHTTNINVTDESQVYTGYDVAGNKGFTGPLVEVEKTMTMHGIILDGFYHIQDTSTATYASSNNLCPDKTKYQTPTAPLVNIKANADLDLYAGSELRWNYNNNDGGGVYNAGTLIVREGSKIINNAVLANDYDGGGVYLAGGGKLIVSDMVTINNNKELPGSEGEKNNNVYLEKANSVVQVGTLDPSDALTALDNNAKVGVTKGEWGSYYYTPIVYSDADGEFLTNIIPAEQNASASDYLIFDDDEYYKVVTLNNSPGYEPSSNYLFWVGTWVTKVHEQPSTYNPGTDPVVISTREDLAWAISVVNGLNEQTPAPGTNFIVTKDINMDANIWVPMGTSSQPYIGTFDANGHTIIGVRSPLNNNEMGMFGTIGGDDETSATIKNMVLKVDFSGGNYATMGSVAANMKEGTISNVEAGGSLVGTSFTTDMGGLVGKKDKGTIHSSFAVNTMTTENAETNMGGLVAVNKGDLLNSYANVTMSGSNKMGGLASENRGQIENCYVVLGTQDAYPAFAYNNVANEGTINICYTNTAANGYVGTGSAAPTGHGTYGEVMGRKQTGYLYYDNAVTLEANQSENNNYVSDEISYTNTNGEDDETHGCIDTWPGMLSALNEWVKDNSTSNNVYTKWLRPTSININGDLPVLAFEKDNCLGTDDGKFLLYGATAYDENNANVGYNGLDELLTEFNKNDYSSKTPNIFLYNHASNVTNLPKSNVEVFINEDATLKQADDAGAFKATTGITFENSYKNGSAWNALTEETEDLTYDWHFLSSPLTNAKIGITYTDNEVHNWWENEDNAQVADVVDSYLPDHVQGALRPGTEENVRWDIYSFHEPQYHWINLKRNSKSHFHFDEPHANIVYTNETYFEKAKGYMMALETDSYLSNTGTLNNETEFTVNVTAQSYSPGDDELGCNLLGNPYQAYMDMDEFLDFNQMETFWVFMAEHNNYVPYAKDASDNPELPGRFLHPHQGFFVKVTETGSITFKKDMATAQTNAYSYYRGQEHVNYPLVNLFAYNEEGQHDFVVVECHRPEMGGATKMTARTNQPFTLTAQSGDTEYSILFTDEHVKRVPVRFRTQKDGTFTMKWETLHGTFGKLLLIDNITGTTTDMTVNDHYTFEGRADDYANRFYLVFTVTGVEEYDADGEAGFAFFNGNDWIVTGEGLLQLVDVTGRILESQQLTGETNFVHFGKVAAGVYLLRLGEQTQKVIIR